METRAEKIAELFGKKINEKFYAKFDGKTYTAYFTIEGLVLENFPMEMSPRFFMQRLLMNKMLIVDNK